MQLIPHPDFRGEAVTSLDGRAVRTVAGIQIIFQCVGEVGRIALPPPAEPGRGDELWRTTCFEMFLKGEGDFYRELNFSPSGRWAAYAFDHYRAGMRDVDALVDSHFDQKEDHHTLTANIGIDLSDVTHLGLSAVIEEESGDKSYWALAHGGGPPDFHLPSCFLARLPE